MLRIQTGARLVESLHPCMAKIDQVVVFDDNVSLVLAFQVEELVRLNVAEMAQDAPGDPLRRPINAFAIDGQTIRAVGDGDNKPPTAIRDARHLSRANVFQFAVRQQVETVTAWASL